MRHTDTIVVIPCYNEASRLDRAGYLSFLQRHPHVKLRFVDDGSRDETYFLLQTIEALFPEQVSIQRLAVNSGKAEAVRQGMLAALAYGAPFAGYWDADLATPLESVSQFREILLRRTDVDVVLGSRVQLLGRRISRKLPRRLLGRLFSFAASTVVRLPVRDTQCGAKLFRCGPAIARAFSVPFLSRWIFDVEVLCRLKNDRMARDAHSIYEMPLDLWTEVGGSKLKPRDFVRAIGELWQIARTRQSIQPRLDMAFARISQDVGSDPFVLSLNHFRPENPVVPQDADPRSFTDLNAVGIEGGGPAPAELQRVGKPPYIQPPDEPETF